jgi:Fe2+ transport system protein FeoA
MEPAEEHRRLSDVEVGEPVVVRRVHDRDGNALRDLSSLGLFPGVELTVVDRSAAGLLTVEHEGGRVTLKARLARNVFVA